MPQQKMTTTFMQRHGFSDSDLKNLDHDAVLHTLIRDAEEVSRILVSVAGLEPADYEAVKTEVRLEVPLMDRTFALGFIDALLDCKGLVFRCPQCRVWHREKTTLEWWVIAADQSNYSRRDQARDLLAEKMVVNDNFSQKRAIVDERAVREASANEDALKKILENRPCHEGTQVYYDSRPLVLEVKSSVPAAGELLRQMNFYREHAGDALRIFNPRFAVYFSRGVCEYSDVLLDQGIFCFHGIKSKGNGHDSLEDDPMFA